MWAPRWVRARGPRWARAPRWVRAPRRARVLVRGPRWVQVPVRERRRVRVRGSVRVPAPVRGPRGARVLVRGPRWARVSVRERRGARVQVRGPGRVPVRERAHAEPSESALSRVPPPCLPEAPAPVTMQLSQRTRARERGQHAASRPHSRARQSAEPRGRKSHERA